MDTSFEFSRVEWTHPKMSKPIYHGWMLSIKTLGDLMHYKETYEKSLLECAFMDYNKCATRDDEGYVRYTQHLRNNLAVWTSLTAEMKGASFVYALGETSGKKFIAMLNSLPIFVNRNGGYFPQDHNCKILETKTQADYWPSERKQEPHYLQWPNGDHWYCKVGPDDVEVDGKMKWDTRTEAEAAYAKWKQK
jgi:hypothetical protein